MPVIVYLDETGDHGLDTIDADFPVFVVTLVICEIDHYTNQVVPRFYRFKLDYFGHEGVILHSRTMRRAEGPFAFLDDPEKRVPFYTRLYSELDVCDYSVISVAILKKKHKERYAGAAWHPYHLALELALERLLPLLEGLGQTSVEIVAEARGRRENATLRSAFLGVVNNGTYYNSAARFKAIRFRLHFIPKATNIVGTQIADLIGFPVAKYALDPKYPGPLMSIIWKKFYVGRGWIRGLKIFP